MGELIKRYIRLKIEYKTSARKEIRRIEKLVRQAYEILARQEILLDEYKKESYKTKYLNEHKKRIELEKESKEIIKELTDTIKELQ